MDDRTFDLGPAAEPGVYDVSLGGQGPEGMVITRFLWTTTAPGQTDSATGTVGLFANSRGYGWFAIEVDLDDLPFEPSDDEVSRFAEVTITGQDGSVGTWQTPLIVQSMDCGGYQAGFPQGYFYYQGEWNVDFATLGGSPFQVEVAITIRGIRYVGAASWRKIKGEGSMATIAFTPPLPGSD